MQNLVRLRAIFKLFFQESHHSENAFETATSSTKRYAQKDRTPYILVIQQRRHQAAKKHHVAADYTSENNVVFLNLPVGLNHENHQSAREHPLNIPGRNDLLTEYFEASESVQRAQKIKCKTCRQNRYGIFVQLDAIMIKFCDWPQNLAYLDQHGKK